MDSSLKRTNYYIIHIFKKYLFASILAMLATSFAGMIDTVIVGHFLGETGLSAMSLVNSVYLIYYTIGAVIGIGGSTVGAMAVGRNEYDRYRDIFSLATVILLISGIITTVLGLLFIEQISVLLGASGATSVYVKDYLKWYILLGSCTLLVYPPLYFLKIDGRPQASSYLFLLSGGLNIFFSWLFMSPVCNMGIKGASIATGMSMGITAIVGFFVLLKNSKELRFVKCSKDNLREIISLGSPNGLNNLFNALKIFSINAVIIKIGESACLSSFALIKNMSDLTCGVIIGISAALMPIVGIFFGEKDNDSIRRVVKASIKWGMALVIVMVILSGCFPYMWCSLFNVSEAVSVSASKTGLIFLSLSLIPGFINLMLLGYFNTIRRPELSNLILLLRLVLYIIPSAFILGKLYGIAGVYSSLLIADVLTLFTLSIIIYVLKRKNPDLDIYMLDTSNEGNEDVSFSVKNTTDDVVFASEKITEFCEKNEFDAKRTMRLSLCLEEMLTVIITYCMDKEKEQYIDIRIVNVDKDVMIRIRNTGRIFNPVRFYEENKDNEEMMDQVLGIKMIVNTAKDISFHETFGTNNLMVLF